VRRDLGGDERMIPRAVVRVRGLNTMGVMDGVKKMGPFLVGSKMRVLWSNNQLGVF
jgi:hypothetical protein